MYVVGTVAEIGDLASVYQDLNVLFEVELADLEADPDFFATLENNQAFRVTDTAANLGSNNAQLSLATALVGDYQCNCRRGCSDTSNRSWCYYLQLGRHRRKLSG